MGTTVGFVNAISAKKIVVFLLRGNNCRVCKCHKCKENHRFSVAVKTTVGFVSVSETKNPLHKLRIIAEIVMATSPYEHGRSHGMVGVLALAHH